MLTDPSSLRELFQLSGRRLEDYCELLPISPFYKLLWQDGTAFDYVNDQAELDRQIARLSPADVDGYARFLKYSQAAYEEGYIKLGHVAFLDPASMVRAAPSLMRMQAWRSVYSIVSKFVKEPHLRQALSFHTLLVGGSPFASSSIYTLIHALEREGGVWFARGGTGALIAAMTRLFTDIGGVIHTSAEVEEIQTQGDRVTGVRTRNGGTFVADLVASNGDVMHTYAKLLGRHGRGERMARHLRGRRFSMSLFVVYFGLKRPPDAGLAHHTILFGPHYKELIDAIRSGGPLREDFSLYLHAPSVTDPSLAPQGCSTFYALSPVPNLSQAVDWTKEGPRYAQSILDELEARLLPNLGRGLGHPEDLYAGELQGRTERAPWIRFLARADPHAERLFPGAQP